ncbi:MAG: cell division protein ZapE [Deltaproteobacteria bacterium]|nr:MAG: cell division protein ZapE [Deltaproteobacteria bacterium]
MTPQTLTRHPGLDPSCKDCQQLGMVVQLTGEHAQAVPCPCIASRACPACGDSGWVPAYDDDGRRAGMRRCRCVGFHLRLKRFNAMGLPGRLAQSTLANFVLADVENQRNAYAAAHVFAKHFTPGEINRGLVLWGPVGRGKTHLLAGMLRQVAIEHGITARFIEFSHLLSTLKGRFDRGEGAAAVLDTLVGVDVLAIDELGKGMLTEFELATIDELVSRRYNAARTIIATTNFRPGEATGIKRANLADRRHDKQPTLSDRVGERVYSRLQEMCTFAYLGGTDWRQRGSGAW